MRRGRRSTPQRAESRQSGAESVTAAPLALRPCVERDLRERRGGMKVDSCSPCAADPASAANQRPLGEQRRFDRQDVVTRHVLRAVDSLEHKHVEDVRILGLLVHSSKLRRETARASNVYFELIDLRRFEIRIDPTDRPRKRSAQGCGAATWPGRGREKPFMNCKMLPKQWMWGNSLCDESRSATTPGGGLQVWGGNAQGGM